MPPAEFLGEDEDIPKRRFCGPTAISGTCGQPERFAPWIVQIARNLALDHARRAARQPGAPPEPETRATPADRELHELLRDEVMLLPDAFARHLFFAVFQRQDRRGSSAQTLGISRDAARGAIQRGRAELGLSMEKHLHEALADPRAKSSMAGAVMVAVAGISITGKSGASPAVAAAGAATGWALGEFVAISWFFFLVDSRHGGWAGSSWPHWGPRPAPRGRPCKRRSRRPCGRSGLQIALRQALPRKPRRRQTWRKHPLPPLSRPRTNPRFPDACGIAQGRPLRVPQSWYSTDGFHAEAASNAEGEYLMEWLRGARLHALARARRGLLPQDTSGCSHLRGPTFSSRADRLSPAACWMHVRNCPSPERFCASAAARPRATLPDWWTSRHPRRPMPPSTSEPADIEADGYRNEHVPAQELLSTTETGGISSWSRSVLCGAV